MAEKEIISVRFGDNSHERMTADEWQIFRRLSEYFDISEGALVEAALHYEVEVSAPSNERYRFDSANFDEICIRITGLSGIRSSLNVGKLDRDVMINSPGLSIVVPQESIIRYIPPYVLSIEPTYQVRINIDLSHNVSIVENGKRLIIACNSMSN
ncbi:MAG TPA: hypothetical protein PLZ77_09945 [Lachnospiraceae bacterium]|nr:hypothetical protein [Lachnospiraceae bacterium]